MQVLYYSILKMAKRKTAVRLQKQQSFYELHTDRCIGSISTSVKVSIPRYHL
jgi:hypothetical protein